MEAKFCPFCQRKNKPDAIRCAHCGVLLIAHKPGAFTTMSVNSPTTSLDKEQSGCAERIGHIPADSFALFVLDFSEPIILRNHAQLLIGRENQATEKTAVLDLTRYGDLAQGISRHHAMIRHENNSYAIEDMGSTNGTWLNRSRLTPGQSYQLRNDDQLWLGPLKLIFCAAQPDKQVTFSLRSSHSQTGQEHVLTPQFMAAEVTPYLQALAQLAEARAHCLGESVEPLHILSVTETAAGIQIQIEGINHLLILMEKWVARWRDEHLEMVGTAHPEDAQWQEQLRPLALRVAEFLQPTLAAKEIALLVDAFIPPLARLVSSPLDFLMAV